MTPLPTSSQDIPDARAILADPKLRYADLNRKINQSYVRFGQLFQQILDPGFKAGSQVNPSWYAMASYPSRVAGQGMLAADQALSVVQHLQAGDSTSRALTRVYPDLSENQRAKGDRLVAELPTRKLRLAAAFLVAYFLGESPSQNRALPAFLDPRVLTICAYRLVNLVNPAPGGVTDQFASLAQTVKNALEDGNRRIFSDIGVAAQDHLEFRRSLGCAPTPEQVLARASSPEQAVEVYRRTQTLVDGPLPTNMGELFPGCDTRNMLTAAFALYEEAGPLPAGEHKQNLIAFADNLMAYHEQKVVAQPAFEPAAPPTAKGGCAAPPAPPVIGEVPRMALFEVLTPDVHVDTRSGRWSYSDYASQLPDQDGSILTPPVTEHNWGRFEDRWPPIMDFFNQCYAQPGALWPMPDPEPTHPI